MTTTTIDEYRLLGRTGLRVAPMCLGTGTFGQSWGPGWTIEKPTARKVFQAYVEAGGNFLDTANGYQGGESEVWLGELLREHGERERMVVATKFSFGTREGDPNAGGNGRKHVLDALDASLRRLQLEHVDLYWLHVWDLLTPVEEVMSTLDALVRSGKVRYVGLSNVPGWYVGRAQTLAEWRGWERIAALQVEYSLITRETEHEYVPAAKALGIGLCPWSPLANGVLTGKYRRTDSGQVEGEGRLGAGGWTTGVNSDLRERNQRIVDAVVAVAKELGCTPAQVALAWVTNRPGVSSTVIGATKPEQVADNLGALKLTLPERALRTLDEVSALPLSYPQGFFAEKTQESVRNKTRVRPVV